jgi:hypothetical protein
MSWQSIAYATFIAARPNSVIDLTGDDEDTAKALAASMETRPMFGPSNRVDDTQQWAMVPSNVSGRVQLSLT